MNTAPPAQTVLHQTPSVEVYCALRVAAGLSAKPAATAARGLPATLFAVQVQAGGQTVAMGRVIGDGGCFFQVVDIAVQPAWQGQGLGKRVMAEIRAWLDAHVPPGGYVSLIADGEAHRLYAQYGFALTAPGSVGMAWKAPRG